MTADNEMVTVWIEPDEWYPVYSVEMRDNGFAPVRVSRATLERWVGIAGAFNEIQVEMRQAQEGS
jgi:hypothetical protein